MSITAESIKSNIKQRLLEMVESRYELIKHARLISCLGITVNESRLYIGDCFESVTETYLKNLCEKLTREHANGTPAKVSLDIGLYKIISGRERKYTFSEQFLSHVDGDPIADKALIEVYLAEVKFIEIAESINHQLEVLEAEGLKLLAKIIIDDLNLKIERGHYEPYKKAGRIICQTWAVSYNDAYSRVNKQTALKDAFRIIEVEAEISLTGAFADYISAIKNLSWSQEKIASRTSFGKGSHLEILCFKDKHEYRFSVQAFDALMAFLIIHGESDVVNRVIEKTGLLEVA